MYVIAVEDKSQVLGFQIFSGYTEHPSFNVELSRVEVVSFADDKKFVFGGIYLSLEFARDEAIRHTRLIQERLGQTLLMYPMPVFELERRMRDWK